MKTFLLIIGLSVGLLGILACGSLDQSEGVTAESGQAASNFMEARRVLYNEETGERLFTNVKVQREEAQLVLTVGDIWYGIPKHLQDRLIDTWIGDWKTVAGNNGWTGLARVQFVDVAGKQVAYKSRSIK